jgi:hypothetical protein
VRFFSATFLRLLEPYGFPYRNRQTFLIAAQAASIQPVCYAQLGLKLVENINKKHLKQA